MATSISILGCGWLGLPLAHELLSKGYEVKGATTSEEKLKQLKTAGIKPYLIRLEPELECDDCSSFWQSRILILNIPPGKKKDESQRVEHAKQVETVLREVAKNTSNVEWIIYTSSTSVYADEDKILKEEDAKLTNDLKERGQRVLKAENLLREAGIVDTTIIRFGGLYGYDRHPVKYMQGKKALKRADAPVNLIHQDDCLKTINTVIEQNARNEVFNAVSDGHPPRKTFYTAAAKHFGLEPPTFEENKNGSKSKIISNQKIKDKLGYQFLYPNPMDHTP